MAIKNFKDYSDSNSENINERTRTELFGNNRKPSNVISRQNQDFYDFYTRGKFRGLSKYELNTEVFKLAQKKDPIGVLAQFCLQIERESVAADDYIVSIVDELTQNTIDMADADDGHINEPVIPKEIEDIKGDIEDIKDEIE